MKAINRILGLFNRHYPRFIGISFIFIVASIVFINVFPFNVAEFKSIAIKNTVQAGGILEYTNDYCQNLGKNTERTLERFLIAKDETLINPIELSSSPEDETLQDKGCRLSAPVKISLPLGIPTGEYKLRVKACYEVLLRLKCVTVQGESDYFMVTRPSIAEQLSTANTILEEVNNRLKSSENTSSRSVSNARTIQPAPVVTPPTPNTHVQETAPPTEQDKSLLESTINTVNGILNLLI